MTAETGCECVWDGDQLKKLCQGCIDAELPSSKTSPDFEVAEILRAHNKRLRAALQTIAVGTPDLLPPYRIMGESQLRGIARKALDDVPPDETKDTRHCAEVGCFRPRMAYSVRCNIHTDADRKIEIERLEHLDRLAEKANEDKSR